MKLPKFSIKGAKKFIPSFRTTVIILVVILLFVLVVVMRNRKEGFVEQCLDKSGNQVAKSTIVTCNKYHNTTAGGTYPRDTSGYPTTIGAMITAKVDGKRRLYQLGWKDGVKNGTKEWRVWRCFNDTLPSCTKGDGEFNGLPSGVSGGTTGTAPAPPVLPVVPAAAVPVVLTPPGTSSGQGTSVVEPVTADAIPTTTGFVDVVVGLWNLLLGGTANEDAPNKFSSVPGDLVNKEVYLKWGSCTKPNQMFLTGHHTCENTSGYNYAFSEADKSKYIWKITPRIPTSRIALYTIENVDRSSRCGNTSFLSVHEECSNNTVAMKKQINADNTILWAVMTIPNRAGKYAFVNLHRIMKKCDFIALSFKIGNNTCTGTLTLDKLGVGNAKAVEIALVTPSTVAPAAAATVVVPVATSPQFIDNTLAGPSNEIYTLMKTVSSIHETASETTKFIFRKHNEKQYMHNGNDKNGSRGRVDVVWYNDINDSCRWRLRGENHGWWSLSPWDNDKDKNFVGTIKSDTNIGTYANMGGLLSCDYVDVSKRWDLHQDYLFNGRYRWRFEFSPRDGRPLFRLINESAEKTKDKNVGYTHGINDEFTDRGCQNTAKYLNLDGFPAKLDNVGSVFEVFAYKP
jgi:hypothetical protein